MSQLGSVYVICIDKRQKDKYPVVYMNQDYLYCKVHGSSDLRRFEVPGRAFNTFNYEEFRQMYDDGRIECDAYYRVYVPVAVKTFFEWIQERSPLEKEIERVQKVISQYRNQVHNYEVSIVRRQAEIKRVNSLIDTEMKNLEILQKKLNKMDEVSDV